MKCILKRIREIEVVKRWAVIGKQDIDRGIYLGFLRHIQETSAPTYRTINTTLLEVPETSQRGEYIVDLLVNEGLVATTNDYANGEILHLTDVGHTALENKIMIEPSEGDYKFHVVIDDLYPQKIINCFPDHKKQNSPNKKKNETAIPWLKMPEFPVSTNGMKLDYTHPKQYFLPEKKNEALYLYSINELGESPEKTKDVASILVTLEPYQETKVEIDTKSGRFPIDDSPGKELTCKDILTNIPDLPDNLQYISELDELISISSYADLNDDEKKRGIVSYPLSHVKLPEYGVFDLCLLVDIKVMVDSEESILTWAFHRVLEQIDHYITPEEYKQLQKSAALWCSEHVADSLEMNADMIQTNLPTYSLLTNLLQGIKPESQKNEYLSVFNAELEKALIDKPALRWYILAPSLLTLSIGGDINAA